MRGFYLVFVRQCRCGSLDWNVYPRWKITAGSFCMFHIMIGCLFLHRSFSAALLILLCPRTYLIVFPERAISGMMPFIKKASTATISIWTITIVHIMKLATRPLAFEVAWHCEHSDSSERICGRAEYRIASCCCWLCLYSTNTYIFHMMDSPFRNEY